MIIKYECTVCGHIGSKQNPTPHQINVVDKCASCGSTTIYMEENK